MYGLFWAGRLTSFKYRRVKFPYSGDWFLPLILYGAPVFTSRLLPSLYLAASTFQRSKLFSKQEKFGKRASVVRKIFPCRLLSDKANELKECLHAGEATASFEPQIIYMFCLTQNKRTHQSFPLPAQQHRGPPSAPSRCVYM